MLQNWDVGMSCRINNVRAIYDLATVMQGRPAAASERVFIGLLARAAVSLSDIKGLMAR
jgi:hypothetical protein